MYNKIYNMDCREGFEMLQDKSVDIIATSPPYAKQRQNQYGGVSEKDYPLWTLSWMESAKRTLKDDGSVFINIRPHIKNGVISDYVLKTRLLLRENGWYECEEIIWIKPDSPPLGSIKRPRRAWESIHWFSKINSPYCDPKANGTQSNRIGFENSKFEQGGKSHIHAGQNDATSGIARCRDYIEVGTGKIEKGIKHPAMYPIEIPEYLVKMCSHENGVVVDPFMGSGSTAIACLKQNRRYVGFDINKEYVEIAEKRISNF